jgi:hypothetical protein
MTSSGTITIDTDYISVELATAFGPRIVGLRPGDGPNLFVDLGDFSADLPDGRRYFFRGGHRLWLAPEVIEITYEPDNDPVATTMEGLSASVSASSGGIEKTIRIAVDSTTAMVTVDHSITNEGDEPRECVPWAITQLRPGGMGLLPLGIDHSDPHGLQAYTRVIGWPYTDWTALASSPDHDVLYVNGTRETPTKVGTSLTRGWLAYEIDGWLFAKYAATARPGVDLGAAGQLYACKDFVELESLGQLATLAPGETTEHREIWKIWPTPVSLEAAATLIETSRP